MEEESKELQGTGACLGSLAGGIAPSPIASQLFTHEPQNQRNPKPKRKAKPKNPIKPTAQQLDLFKLAGEIWVNDAKESGLMGFIATAMIWASLPHSKIDGASFKRNTGEAKITILNDPDIGLPYGKIPRLITAFLCTEAKRTGEPTIDLGSSQNAFAKKLGIGTNGGERGGLTAIKEQAKRLFTSRITITRTQNSEFMWNNVDITDSGVLLWNPHEEESRPWQSYLTLSKKFFDECLEHSVPIDMRVLNKLRSPLAIDIYIWMTYRYNAICRPTPISWSQLRLQFGSNYSNDEKGLYNFIANFRDQLKNVSILYPQARYSIDERKLTLLPSKPHVLN